MLSFKTDFYQNLFDSFDNNAVLMRVEDDGTYYPIWCSKEFSEMMEGTEEEFIRKEAGGTMSTIHPDDRDDVGYLFKNHTTRDGGNSLTVRKYTLKGNTVWVNIHYAFVEEDGVLYAYCTYTDVTEIKESQAQIERMYKSTVADLESLSHGALTFLRVDLTTDVMEDIRGSDAFPFDPTPGADHLSEWNQFFPLESDQKRFAERFSAPALIEAFNNGTTYMSDYFYTQRRSGRKCFVKVTENIRQEPTSGDIISFFTEYDYTEEMVNQVVQTKALVEQYDMITYVIDGEYGVVIGDAEHIQKGSIFPKARKGHYKQYISDQVIPVLHGTDEEKEEMARSLLPETVESALDSQDHYETHIVCEIDGEVFHKRFVFYMVNKEARFYVLMKSDVTAVIKEQQERNELLSNALKEAEDANAAKTSFLSSMSHEIRTPMNAIIGLDSIALKDPDLPASTREYLEKIDASAKHLLELINDILDMSRIESGRMTIKNEEFSFREMLDQINTMINGQCEDNGLTYDFRIIGDVGDYYIGDDMKLKQVIINILGNSVKFTPAGGTVSFIVERTAQYEGRSTLRFIMMDTGIGMDESYLPRVFDAFSQEDVNKANKYGSTGLGMAITKSIVEMMNGNITVKSKKGAGTEFTVTITLSDSKLKGDNLLNLNPQDMDVLIIDDDPIACEHAKLVLSEIGVKGETAIGGEEALKLIELRHARREFYNLILVDWKMPGQDGVDVTRRIRELYSEESVIVILTSYDWEDVVDEALEAGVDGFMAKPLISSDVMGEYKQALSRRQASESHEQRKADLAGKRILMAEDVAINAEIMKTLLEMRQMTVECAENGKIVVDKYAASPGYYYDAILMDVRMPEKNGLEATADIRNLDRPDAKSIPIIAMTANAFDEDVERSLQAGMNAHLSKPVEPDRLYETLESLIDDRDRS